MRLIRRRSSGPWDRDLDLDLDAIVAWDATAVLTLVEQFELENLQVAHLGQRVIDRHMEWFHPLIVDVSVPDAEFEKAWSTAGACLRSTLRSGSKVLVHCRGGMGRAGTIAARLMVELGFDPQDAIDRVRSVRPGAIETMEQEDHVRSIVPIRMTPMPSVTVQSGPSSVWPLVMPLERHLSSLLETTEQSV